MKTVAFKPFSLAVHGRLVEFDRPAVMGILNVTPDSFYDGGQHASTEAMLAHALRLADEGADVIDIGVVSSRPGALLLEPEEEALRLEAAVRQVRAILPEAILSVDTCYALPASRAVEAGADIVNDIGGGSLDPDMFRTVADLQVPYLMMHMRGTPQSMQQLCQYDDIVAELTRYFSQKLNELYRLGAKDVWIDPGFGFAKSTEQNHELLHRLDELCTLFDEPVVAALSRKSMIYRPLGITPSEALPGTVALCTMALERGARVLRVHDVREARQVIDLLHYYPK